MAGRLGVLCASCVSLVLLLQPNALALLNRAQGYRLGQRNMYSTSSTLITTPSQGFQSLHVVTNDAVDLNTVKFASATSHSQVREAGVRNPEVKLWIVSNDELKGSTISFHQSTDSNVLRSFMPTLMTVSLEGALLDEAFVHDFVEESIFHYLGQGCRSTRLEVQCDAALVDAFVKMGFRRGCLGGVNMAYTSMRDAVISKLPSSTETVVCDARKLLEHCQKRIETMNKNDLNLHVVNDILGRLHHEIGQPKESISYYTSALQANPKSAVTFRNLGSAYHAKGDLQMAFASYQQSIQLDAEDAFVYLKLAFFYENFASMDWADAGDHAERCYRYYLANVDPRDSGVLTRLGNLLVREHKNKEAAEIFEKVLEEDASLHNVWFNKAHAQLKYGDTEGAAESLKRTLALDDSILAARHMLRALTEHEADVAQTVDMDYVKELFNDYAPTYDDHFKKLLYSAPRIIRQEMGKIYKTSGQFTSTEMIKIEQPGAGDIPDDGIVIDGDRVNSVSTLSAAQRAELKSKDVLQVPQEFAEAEEGDNVGTSCQTYKSFVNNSLDVLDLGCGTGLAGAWLKDYAKTLVGVDVAEQMVERAKKKMLYTDLHCSAIDAYLDTKATDENFDLVVAADVLSYIGDLGSTFDKVKSAVRPGGHFVFTAEAMTTMTVPVVPEKGYKLMQNGRFGYTRRYIDDVIDKTLGEEFQVVMTRDFSPRLDAGDPVAEYLYIVRRQPLI